MAAQSAAIQFVANLKALLNNAFKFAWFRVT